MSNKTTVFKWVEASDRLPELGKNVFWDRGEEPPAWGHLWLGIRVS